VIRKYVLDACALIAYIHDENGAEVMSQLFAEASKGVSLVTIGKTNLLEVHYGISRDFGLQVADDILTRTTTLPLQINDFISNDLLREASRLKVSYKLSLADALALGLASVSAAAIVTADHHEMDSVDEREAIEFCWIR
jgi:PIN domain nuclease of toxin-antitoxin system